MGYQVAATGVVDERLGVPVVCEDTTVLSRSDWLALRKQGIGGSDAPAILGFDRWASALEVWVDKTSPVDVDDDDSEAALWGRLLEDVVAAEFGRRAGLDVLPQKKMFRHPDLPWALANPDRLVADPDAPGGLAVLECKTCSVYVADEWDAGPAIRALIQSNHYMAVLGLRRAYVAVLIGGQRFEWFRVDWDGQVEDNLLQAEADFWCRVVDGDPPPPTGMPSDTRLLGGLWEAKPGSACLVDEDEVSRLIELRQEAADDAAAALARKDEYSNRLKVMLGEHELGVAPSGRVLFTWKQHDTSHFDTAGLKAEMPRFYRSRCKTTPERRLWVPKSKDGE